jgi:hypothetical protein
VGKVYETGMKITYEPRSKTVIVAFRGRLQVLSGPYENESEALAAGEAYCRLKGWSPAEAKAKLRTAW